MAASLRALLDDWSARHGVSFVWVPTKAITYTDSVGAWHLRTGPINGEDDWISIHPRADGSFELELVADAGHVEVYRLDLDGLAGRLAGALEWFAGWTSFYSQGPGPGH